ncbi:MAG: hypothetical protein IJB71_03800 [Bacilli bacterium]|nr:hypothetical protein [Bacilli bacterium]
MDFEFASLKELHDRLIPALTTKCNEMKRVGFSYIKEEDIWNYLKEIKWKKASNLALHEMVNDVLNTENGVIDAYLKEKIKDQTRTLNLE